ncbi:MAG: hypothetical protein KDD82_00140, partial [Planctomycetes bacterium]|nr:hypothetical protein [Planctomycetota bacterium]
ARFLDVHYADLVADPAAVAARVCATFGHPCDASHRVALEEWARAHPAPRHRCPPEVFGVEPTQVARAFAGYRTWLAARGLG